MLFVCHPKILHKQCLQFLLGVKMAPRETENNAYAKFWGDKQRALWYVMGFSGVVNCKFVKTRLAVTNRVFEHKEYQTSNTKMTTKPRSRVGILIYRTWAIKTSHSGELSPVVTGGHSCVLLDTTHKKGNKMEWVTTLLFT